MDWIENNAISLLWMVVVLVSVYVVVHVVLGTDVSKIAVYTKLEQILTQTIQDELKRRANERYESEERQQQYWKERHRHENPQCEVCKEEEEANNRRLISKWRLP